YAHHRDIHSFPTRRSSDLEKHVAGQALQNREGPGKVLRNCGIFLVEDELISRIDIGAADDHHIVFLAAILDAPGPCGAAARVARSEEHTSELQSRSDLVCR